MAHRNKGFSKRIDILATKIDIVEKKVESEKNKHKDLEEYIKTQVEPRMKRTEGD